MTDTPSDAGVPTRQGQAWSDEEDRHLYDGFVGGQSVDSLASVRERSVGGIRSRLGRLGLIDQNGEVVKPPPPFTAIRRRRSTTPGTQAADPEDDAARSVFAIRTGDGWVVEIKSNRPLTGPLVDRLTQMLHRVLAEEDAQ